MSEKGERRFWNYLRPNVRFWGHFDRIESGSTAIGTPDVNYCIAGRHNHIELKHTDSESKGLTLRPSQVGWFNRRVRAGGKPGILVRSEIGGFNTHFYIPYHNVKFLAGVKNVEHWLHMAGYVWMGEIEWPTLRTILINPDILKPGEDSEEPSSSILSSPTEPKKE